MRRWHLILVLLTGVQTFAYPIYIVCALFQVGVIPVLGIPLAAVIMYLVGVLLYRLAIFRVVGHDFFISILATFGLSILIQQLLNQVFGADVRTVRSEEHTSELQSLMRISYAVFCLQKKTKENTKQHHTLMTLNTSIV